MYGHGKFMGLLNRDSKKSVQFIPDFEGKVGSETRVCTPRNPDLEEK